MIRVDVLLVSSLIVNLIGIGTAVWKGGAFAAEVRSALLHLGKEDGDLGKRTERLESMTTNLREKVAVLWSRGRADPDR